MALHSLRFIPDQYSLFKVCTISFPRQAGYFLKENKITIEKYWELGFSNKLPNKENEVVEGLNAVLLDTVKMHLLSDVPVGAFP